VREKIFGLFLLVVAFCLGSGFNYYLMSNNDDEGVIISSTDTTGVIKCNDSIKIDETGISTSVGKIYDATVTIQNYQKNVVASSGSGFIYKQDDKYGYIMTNHHVIDKATSLKITLSNDDVIDGTLLGSDEYLDLAVVRIDKKYVKQVATLGDSSKSSVGDTVFTVGTPIEYEYRGTVTKGTLSGKNRMVSVTVSTTDDWIMKVLQVDAAINPGNSGGPLLNVNGEVIGINSLKLVEDEIEGMGFAIPIEYAMEYVDELENGKKIERPLIGITMLNTTDTFGLYQNGIMLDKDITNGVVVLSVSKNSAAEEAGLEKGDVITKIGGKKVKNAAYLKFELYQYKPGDKVQVTYIRDKEEKTATLKLTKAD